MKRFKVTVDGTPYDVVVEETAAGATPAATVAAAQATPAPAATPTPAPVAPATSDTTAPVAGADVMEAPMPGTILDVKVKAGDSVKAGQVLAILEAMKMENEITAPSDAVVVAVHVNKNDIVNAGDALISLN